MDSLQIVVVASPFANMTSLYEVDPEADVLLIVPPFNTTPGLRLKVSSRHLSLSSKPFKTKLSQIGTKTSSTQSDGRVHVSLTPGFDPKAVTIVLNALHGRGSKVPRQLNGDLELLAKIAHVVDKFQLYDALEIYADRWIGGLWRDVHAEDLSEQDLVFWIYISYVFKQAEIFRQVTRQAALSASGPLDTLGLPIKEKIIKHIEAQRQELLTKSLSAIHSAIQELLGVSSSPSSDSCLCDKFLLGDLIKTLHKSGHTAIWSPPVKGAPIHASFRGVVEALSSTSYQLDSHAHSQAATSRGGGFGRATPTNKRKNGAVNGNGQLITPDSSPEQRPVGVGLLPGPRIADGASLSGQHDCAARKVFARLDGVEDLEDGVKGLELVSGLGYQLY